MHQIDQILSPFETQSIGFLRRLRRLDIGSNAATAVIADFDSQHFKDTLFETMSVTRPKGLEQAVLKRRAEFLAGRVIAQAALTALGRKPDDILIGPNREPLWPDGVTGSITHSNGRCAVVVSDLTGVLVGTDIEDVADATSLDSIFQVALLPGETRLILAQDKLPPAVLATLVFSAKETLYKALFPLVRQFFGFDHAMLDGPPSHMKLRLRLTRSLGRRLDEGTVFEVDYALSNGTVVTWLVTSAPMS